MKKILVFIMLVVLLLSVTACGNNASQEEDSPLPKTEESNTSEAPGSEPDSSEANLSDKTDESSMRSLVIYFSWSGSTSKVANEIQLQTGADIFELVPETPYTKDYNTLLDIAQQEQQDNARPSISGSIENLDSYDVVYIGFPNWWSDMPMILYSFFDNYDLSGKTIAPFCTSGGSGFSSTISTIRDLEPEADVLEGLHIGSAAADDPAEAVTEWLELNNIAQ